MTVLLITGRSPASDPDSKEERQSEEACPKAIVLNVTGGSLGIILALAGALASSSFTFSERMDRVKERRTLRTAEEVRIEARYRDMKTLNYPRMRQRAASARKHEAQYRQGRYYKNQTYEKTKNKKAFR